MNTAEHVQRAVEDCLSGQGLSPKAASKIVTEYLPFLTVWELAPSGKDQLETAEAVVAFAFGFGPARKGVPHPPEQYHPLLHHAGKTNEALANVIVPFAQKGLAVFAQWEVAEALKAHGILVPDRRGARPERTYLGTSGVVEQFMHNGLDQLRSVVLVAHRHHAFRCLETTRALFGSRGNTIDVLVPELPDVYDPDSVQPWTRSMENYVAYEVESRFRNRSRGKM